MVVVQMMNIVLWFVFWLECGAGASPVGRVRHSVVAGTIAVLAMPVPLGVAFGVLFVSCNLRERDRLDRDHTRRRISSSSSLWPRRHRFISLHDSHITLRDSITSSFARRVQIPQPWRRAGPSARRSLRLSQVILGLLSALTSFAQCSHPSSALPDQCMRKCLR